MALLSRSRFAPDTRIATIALALVLAVVSMPTLCRIVLADSHSALTMDICNPMQSIDIASAPLFAAPPTAFILADAPRAARQAIDDSHHAPPGRIGEAPDPPPPEGLS